MAPIAGFNGGIVFNPDMSVIESHRLDPATARRTIDLILGRGLDGWIYTADDWLSRDPKAAHVAHETSNVRFSATVVPSFTLEHLAQVVKIVGMSDDLALVTACEKAAQDTPGEAVSAERSQPFYLDVTHPEANKGAVAVTLSRLHDIPLARIATIGDMPNDIPMFRKSGFPIAMGNSSDGVKAHAQAVTGKYRARRVCQGRAAVHPAAGDARSSRCRARGRDQLPDRMRLRIPTQPP
jgi:hydroxymethylpyrimidine pyrophosphatase-like HAD family hydrolase